MLLELDKLQMDITQEDLKRAVDYTRGRMLLRLEDSGEVMSSLGRQAILSGIVLTPEETIQRLEEVTIGEIQHVAKSLLNYKNYRLSIVGPNKSAIRFLSHLKYSHP